MRIGGSCRLRRLALAALLAGFHLVVLGTRYLVGQGLVVEEVPRERTVPEKTIIDGDMQKSKLTLGPFRFLPSIAVTDAGYDSNVFSTPTNPIADWTATITAGTRILLPMGSKMYFVSNLFPRYTWYDKLNDRNRWGGIYDASIYGFFNRMSFQLTGTDSQNYILYSSELPSYVFENLQSGMGYVDVDLTHSLSLFGRGGYQRVRYTQYSGPPLQDQQVKLNDREDSLAAGGLRYRISEDWSVSAEAETGWSDFVYEPELRDNTSNAYLGGVFFNGPRLYINAMGGYREGFSRNGSLYPEYQTGVGSFFLSFFPLRWLELQGYGHRRVTYSISPIDPYYFDNKVGTGANIELFDHVLVRGYVEDGPNEYPVPQPTPGGLVQRIDHVKYYGGGLSIKLPARIVLTGLVTRQIYESNLPENNRSFNRFTAFLNFTGEYSR